MALVAAIDRPLTTVEIQDWISYTFPDSYNRGCGPWEKNIAAILSQHGDFQKEVIPGERAYRWSFANAQTRDRYEEQFSEYRPGCPSRCNDVSTSRQDPVSIIHRTTFSQDSQPRPKSVKGSTGQPADANMHRMTSFRERSRPRSRLSIVDTVSSDEEDGLPRHKQARSNKEPVAALRPSTPGGNLSTKTQRQKELARENSARVGSSELAEQRTRKTSPGATLDRGSEEANFDREWDDADVTFLPFERKSRNRITLGLDVRVETNFFKAFPEYARPSIESMSQNEVDAKIEEIKKRPSRKATFRKLLASARHFRADVHNELEGRQYSKQSPDTDQAPPYRPRANRRYVEDSTMKDMEQEDGGLPRDPIPMVHEGQLAFRDGTVVSPLQLPIMAEAY